MRSLCAFILLFLCAASTAHAQDPASGDEQTEPQTAEQTKARSLFELGRAAIEAEEFERAIDFFRESLELEDRVATAFNLGLALALAGKPLDSVTQLEAVLAEEHGPITAVQRNEIQNRLTSIRRQLGTLRLHVYGEGPLQIKVDGAQMATAPNGARFTWSFLPGEHDVHARAADGASAHKRVILRADTVETLVLRAESQTSVADATLQGSPSPEDEVDGDDGFPVWAWVALGVLAAGSGIAIFAITQSDDDRPTPVATVETLQVRF